MSVAIEAGSQPFGHTPFLAMKHTALALLLVLWPAWVHAGDQATAEGSITGWLATYLWSDQYCWDAPSSKEPQCEEPHAFVFRSLVQIVNGTPKADCGAESKLPEDLVERLMSLTLNWRKTRELWQKYGACSNLPPSNYAGTIEYVDRRIKWPEAYVADKSGLVVSSGRLFADLSTANPDVPAGALVMQCKGPWLESVTFCMNGDFKYSAAACGAVNNVCDGAIKLRGFRKPPS